MRTSWGDGDTSVTVVGLCIILCDCGAQYVRGIFRRQFLDDKMTVRCGCDAKDDTFQPFLGALCLDLCMTPRSAPGIDWIEFDT